MTGSPNKTDIATPKSNALAWVIALFTVLFGLGGLAAVFTAAYELAERPGLDEGIPIVLMVFGSSSVVGVVALLVNLALKLAATNVRAQQTGPKVIPRRQTNPVQLPAPSAGIASVTEHTTRTFEPVKREDGANE